MPHQRARVDSCNHRDAGRRQKVLRRLIRAPVARKRRELAHHQTFDEWPSRFIVGLIGAVVADLRVGENHDLSGIRRIGEDFLVAGDGGIENDFTCPLDGRTITPALEDGAVFQGEDCGIRQDEVPPDGGNFDLTTLANRVYR